MAKISNADLDQLTSEVLPERSVLGVAGMSFSIGGSEGLHSVGGVVSGGMEGAGSLPS